MKKVLWVDDNSELMENMTQMFLDYGFELLKVTNLTEAYQYLKKGNTNNLLVDVEFPNSSKEGIMFLENIYEEFKDLNIVIYTGYPSTDDTVKIMKERLAADYIKKGILLREEDRQRFFNRLHENFSKQVHQSPEIDLEVEPFERKYKTKDEFIQAELKKWRRKTIYQLLISVLLILITGVFSLYLCDFDFERLWKIITSSKVVSISVSLMYGLINLFLIKNLYDKYNNHSNIGSYTNNVVIPKMPEYLVE